MLFPLMYLPNAISSSLKYLSFRLSLLSLLTCKHRRQSKSAQAQERPMTADIRPLFDAPVVSDCTFTVVDEEARALELLSARSPMYIALYTIAVS